MRLSLPLFWVIPLLSGCVADESLSAYGGAGQSWVLKELDQATYGEMATLNLTTPGEISGQAPCNSYRAQQTAPYPWFEIKALATTRKACPALEQERTYLNALQSMSEAEIAGDVLILRNDSGQEMIFTR
ncbi:META domain-containing protein [Pseudophaeobacter sp.]|uniref:META domain-containing protein n=1 Tax=Pseudophaeobacter sp. TaxID=1971739 RepID=UPI00329A2408